MRNLILILIVVAAFASAPSLATGNGTATLSVDHSAHPLLGSGVDCLVPVSSGQNMGDLLTQATLDGCILGWTFTVYPSSPQYGRFVNSIDGRLATCDAPPAASNEAPVLCSYWALYINGAYAAQGIDQTPVSAGASYAFVYTEI